MTCTKLFNDLEVHNNNSGTLWTYIRIEGETGSLRRGGGALCAEFAEVQGSAAGLTSSSLVYGSLRTEASNTFTVDYRNATFFFKTVLT
jgi:hypothetical protein